MHICVQAQRPQFGMWVSYRPAWGLNVSILLAGSGPELDDQVSGYPAAVFTSMPCALARSRTSTAFRSPAGPRRPPRPGLRALLLTGLQRISACSLAG